MVLFIGHENLEIIDVRGMDFFLGYIPGSRRFPFELFNKEVSRLAGELAESGKMVVFVDKTGGSWACSAAQDFINCVNSASTNPTCTVYILEGGFSSWEAELAGHKDSARYIGRSPNFPGAPHIGLLPAQPKPRQRRIKAAESPAASGGILGNAESGDTSTDLAKCICSEPPEAAPWVASNQGAPSSLLPVSSPVVGDLVRVFSKRSDKWLEGSVIAVGEDVIKVHYIINGKSFAEEVLRDCGSLKEPV